LSATSAPLSAAVPVDDSLDYGLVCGIAGELGLDKALTANQDQDGSGTISLGDTLEYTVTATNTGSVTLSNVVVSDDMITPASTTCATLPQAQTCVLVGTYTVTQADIDTGDLVNTATTRSDQTTERTTVVTTPVPQNPAIELVKEAQLRDQTPPGEPGDVIDYTLTVTNTGDVTLEDVEVVDDLIVLDCSPSQPAVLGPAETMTCTGSYEIRFTDLGSNRLTNVGSVTGDAPDDSVVADDDSAGTPIISPIPVPVAAWPAWLLLIVGIAVIGRRQASARLP
jgi:uncharacterized repeat protein (TIGR01451 family)